MTSKRGLTYPSNLAEIAPSFLQISVNSFKVYSKETWVDPDQFSQRFTGTIGKMINLPIPVGMVDHNESGWSNLMTAEALQNFLNVLGENKFAKYASNKTGLFGEKHIVHEFAGMAAKSYGMSWLFLPQNKVEADTVEEIIKQLKRAQLPSVVSGPQNTRAMRYPDMLSIKVYGNASKNIKFLPCFITSVIVDRNFDDTFIEYKDGNTPAIALSLAVVEISNYNKEIFDRVYGS